ncbi:MAG: hypothetical protein WCA11_06635, partial [Terracidiphilus sp.]
MSTNLEGVCEAQISGERASSAMCRSATVRLSDCDCEGMKLVEMLGLFVDWIRCERIACQPDKRFISLQASL